MFYTHTEQSRLLFYSRAGLINNNNNNGVLIRFTPTNHNFQETLSFVILRKSHAALRPFNAPVMRCSCAARPAHVIQQLLTEGVKGHMLIHVPEEL